MESLRKVSVKKSNVTFSSSDLHALLLLLFILLPRGRGLCYEP